MEENYYTKHIIETNDPETLELYLNAPKMMYALNEIREWRRELYRGKNYDWVVLYKGKLYKPEEWETKNFVPEEEPQFLYTDDAILRRLDDALRTVENIFN